MQCFETVSQWERHLHCELVRDCESTWGQMVKSHRVMNVGLPVDTTAHFYFVPRRWVQSIITADQPLTRDMLSAPWLLTDISSGLVMVIRNYHWLNSATRVLISTYSTPLVQTGERKQTHTVWPWPLTYDLDHNPRLAKVKVDPHAKNKGQMVQAGERHRQTDGHTYATKCIISPATRSIIISICLSIAHITRKQHIQTIFCAHCL